MLLVEAGPLPLESFLGVRSIGVQRRKIVFKLGGQYELDIFHLLLQDHFPFFFALLCAPDDGLSICPFPLSFCQWEALVGWDGEGGEGQGVYFPKLQSFCELGLSLLSKATSLVGCHSSIIATVWFPVPAP